MVGRDYAYHAPGAGDRGDDVRVNNPKADSDGEGCCSIPCLKFALHLFNILFLLSGTLYRM